MEIIVIALMLAFIPSMIASQKGRNPLVWYIYGFFLFIIAFIHILVADEARTRKCPHCSEMVKEDAKVCRCCRLELPS